MQTSKEERDRWLEQPSEIERELYAIWPSWTPLVIADVGACDGLSSVRYGRMYPNATFHLFEPRQDNCELIEANMRDYSMSDRVRIHAHALGAHTNLLPFWESFGQAPNVKEEWDTGNKSSSLLPPKEHLAAHPWCEFRKSMVQCKRLDDINLGYLDLMHIDVQGAEMDVFKGGMDQLSITKAVFCEVSNVELYQGQALKADVVRLLSGCGFEMVKDLCGNRISGDIFMVRK